MSRDLVEKQVLRFLPNEDWPRTFAAIHYNVAVDKSLQIVLGPAIAKVLEDGDATVFSEFATKPGVPEACDAILADRVGDWADENPLAIPLAAIALDTSDGEPAWSACWEWLLGGLAGLAAMPIADRRAGVGLTLLLKHSEHDKSTTEKTLQLLSEASRKPEPEDDWKVGAWLTVAEPVLKAVSGSEQSAVINTHLSLAASAADYIEIVTAALAREGWRPLKHCLRPSASGADIIAALAETVAQGQMKDNHVRAARHVAELMGGNWDPLGAAIGDRLQASNDIPAAEIVATLASSCVIVMTPVVSETDTPLSTDQLRLRLGQLADKGHLYHHAARLQNNAVAAGSCIAVISLWGAGVAPNGQVGNSHKGTELLKQITDQPSSNSAICKSVSDFILRHANLKTLLNLADRRKDLRPMLSHGLEQSGLKGDYARAVAPEDWYPTGFDFLLEALGDDGFLEFLQDQLDKGAIEHLIEYEFHPEDSPLFVLALKASEGSAKQENLMEHLKKGLLSLEKQSFIPQLRGEGPLLDLIEELHRRGIGVSLSYAFGDALETIVQEQREGKAIVIDERWNLGFQLMSADDLANCMSKLWRRMISLSDKPIAELLPAIGTALADSLTEDHYDTAVQELFAPCVARGDLKELRWLALVAEGAMAKGLDLALMLRALSRRDYKAKQSR